jgi:hypothetical protein
MSKKGKRGKVWRDQAAKRGGEAEGVQEDDSSLHSGSEREPGRAAATHCF